MAVTPAVEDRPLRELRGVVERITYQNAENGFTVARLAPERPEAEAESARAHPACRKPGPDNVRTTGMVPGHVRHDDARPR